MFLFKVKPLAPVHGVSVLATVNISHHVYLCGFTTEFICIYLWSYVSYFKSSSKVEKINWVYNLHRLKFHNLYADEMKSC